MSSANVTPQKNTKAEIFSAYQIKCQELRSLKATKLNPEKIKVGKRKAATAEKVKGLSIAGISKSIETLETRATGFLSGLRDEYEGELEKLNDVKQAITDADAELQEIFGISREAETMAALVQAQKELAEKEAEARDYRREQFEEDMRQAKKNWQESKTDYEKSVKREMTESTVKREQELADAEYAFARQVKEKTDSLTDQLDTERKKFNEWKELETKGLNGQRESFFKDRSAQTVLETEIKGFETRISEFETEKETAVATAITAAKSSAQKSFGIEVNAIKRNYEADLKVKDGEVTSLTSFKNSLDARVQDLSAKLEVAYEKVQAVAVQALQAQGSVNTVAQVQAAVANRDSKR